MIERHSCPWWVPPCGQCLLRDRVVAIAETLSGRRGEPVDSRVVVRFLTEGADAGQRRLARAEAATSGAAQATWSNHQQRAVALVVLGPLATPSPLPTLAADTAELDAGRAEACQALATAFNLTIYQGTRRLCSSNSRAPSSPASQSPLLLELARALEPGLSVAASHRGSGEPLLALC